MRFVIFSFFILFSTPLFAQVSAIVELSKCSALSIFVETNMMNFCLVQKGDKLLRTPVAISANLQKNKLFVDHNTLEIEVKGFKSENVIGQNEFYKLMNVERFPKMYIELVRFDACSECKLRGNAILNITITNVTRMYEFPVVIGRNADLMHIVGKKRIFITDFGLSAPTNLLFGLAKVNEQVVIDLNILCKYRLKSEDVAER